MQLRSTCGQFQLFYASGPVWRESLPTRTVPGVDAARKCCARVRGEDVAGLTSVRALAHFVVCIGEPRDGSGLRHEADPNGLSMRVAEVACHEFGPVTLYSFHQEPHRRNE